MTEKRIDQLDAIGAITGDDLVPMWDSGTSATKHVTAANARTYMAAESAPIDATYVTLSTNATLTGERVLTAGSNIALTDAGAGSTLTVAATGLLPLAAAGASVENIGAVEWNVNTVASSGSTETLDTSLYGTHDVTMSENCTFTFSNPAPSGKETEFKLILRGAFTPTFPAAVDWPDASAPTYTTPSVYVFFTVDAGTTWFGAQAGKAFG